MLMICFCSFLSSLRSRFQSQATTRIFATAAAHRIPVHPPAPARICDGVGNSIGGIGVEHAAAIVGESLMILVAAGMTVVLEAIAEAIVVGVSCD